MAGTSNRRGGGSPDSSVGREERGMCLCGGQGRRSRPWSVKLHREETGRTGCNTGKSGPKIRERSVEISVIFQKNDSNVLRVLENLYEVVMKNLEENAIWFYREGREKERSVYEEREWRVPPKKNHRKLRKNEYIVVPKFEFEISSKMPLKLQSRGNVFRCEIQSRASKKSQRWVNFWTFFERTGSTG